MKPHQWILFALGLCLWANPAPGEEPWTLDRALQYALTHNPDARLARSRIEVAQAGLQQANASFWPRVQVQSSYTRTDNPMLVFGSILNQRAFYDTLDFNDVPDGDNLNTKGLVTMPIYSGGRTKAATGAAEANTRAAKEDKRAIWNSLSFEVARSYYTVLKTREFIRAAQAAVSAFETNSSVAEKRLAGGTLLKTDLLDLQVRTAQAREDLVRAENANALATRALRNLLGIESGDFAVSDVAPDAKVPAEGDFAQRAELIAAGHRARAAEEQVRGAKSGYLPRISAFGSLDYDYGWKFDEGAGSYAAGGVLQWDVWDGNGTRAKVREARANLDSAREEERKIRLVIDLEVEQARLDLKAANERILVTEETVAQAAESADLARAWFREGNALSTQLVDAETALLSARVRRTEAQADQRIATAALKKALGLPQTDPENGAEKR